MNISAIIGATILVAAVGLFIGVFLGVAGKKFAVEVDEKEVAIREALPGNNCGGCGYPGCDGLAAAIAKGEAPVNRCPVGGEPVGKIIAGIMGQEAVETARQVAHVKCSGTCDKAKEEYVYTGVEDCEMLPFVPNGGAKACTSGKASVCSKRQYDGNCRRNRNNRQGTVCKYLRNVCCRTCI